MQLGLYLSPFTSFCIDVFTLNLGPGKLDRDKVLYLYSTLLQHSAEAVSFLYYLYVIFFVSLDLIPKYILILNMFLFYQYKQKITNFYIIEL